MKNCLTVLFLICSLTACASPHSGKSPDDDPFDDFDDVVLAEIWDPLEPINKVSFEFNDSLYKNVLTPVNNAYIYITPKPVHNAVGNLLHEVSVPIRVFSSITQLDFPGAMSEIAATMLNLTWGTLVPVLDLVFDLDKEMFALVELESDPEDLGQSLGYWGVKHGIYLVLPIFGPSSLRDFTGTLAGSYLSPISYTGDIETQLAIRSMDTLHVWSLVEDQYNTIQKVGVDPYTSAKEFYQQKRNIQIGK